MKRFVRAGDSIVNVDEIVRVVREYDGTYKIVLKSGTQIVCDSDIDPDILDEVMGTYHIEQVIHVDPNQYYAVYKVENGYDFITTTMFGLCADGTVRPLDMVDGYIEPITIDMCENFKGVYSVYDDQLKEQFGYDGS